MFYPSLFKIDVFQMFLWNIIAEPHKRLAAQKADNYIGWNDLKSRLEKNENRAERMDYLLPEYRGQLNLFKLYLFCKVRPLWDKYEC